MDKDTRADYANVERDASQKNRSVSDLASFLVANFQTSMVQGVGTVKSVTYSDDGKTVVSAVADVSGSEEAVNVPYGKTVRVADQILMNRPKNARTDPTWDYIRTIGSSEPLPEIRLPNENLPMVNIRNLTLLPNLPGVGTQTANLAFKLDAIDTIFHPAKYIIAYYPTALAVAVPFPDFWHQFDVSIPSLVSTKLTAAIGLTDDSCYLQSDRYFPNADTIAIGDELVTYTGFDRPNLHITGISRHQLGTTAKTHPANEQVIDLQKAITTLTADVSNTEMSVIHVTSAAGFDNTNGVIRIDSEEIGYATRTGTTQFNGLTRPNPTIHLSGISHTNGTTVFEALPPVSGDINTLDLNTDYSVSITWQNGVNQIAQ